MIYYATIDTNVVVSSLLKPGSIPDIILEYIRKGIIIPLLNNEILNEYKEVLNRNNFDFSSYEIETKLEMICKNAIFLNREKTIEKFIDNNDIVFYEIVMSARSIYDAYLITGNKKHFPSKPYVVTPRQMLEIIEENDKKRR